MNVDVAHGGLANGFLELPEAVYEGDAQWIPEDAGAVTAAFSAANPWFDRGQAATFCLPGAARAAAFRVPDLEIEGQQAGFFGYFESVGDEAAERSVFDALEDWTRTRGASVLFGPINFSTYGNYRLRLSAEAGADTFLGEPYNPARYPTALEKRGYTLHQSYCTQIFNRQGAQMVIAAYAPIVERLRSDGYQIKPLTPEIWLGNLDELHPLVDRIFAANFAYTPLPYEAFVNACGAPFAKKMCGERSMIAWGPEGDIAGFLLVYPHYGGLVSQAAGDQRVLPEALDYAVHTPLLPKQGRADAIYKTVGVAPHHRRKGVMESFTQMLAAQTIDSCERWFGALIRDDNPSRKVGGGFLDAERRYGLFRKSLTST